MTRLPLLAPRDLDAPLAWRGGVAVSGAQFLAAAARLAERLPARGRPINLCQDRLHFALGLAAALLRGQTSLMPPNALPETLRQLPPGDASAYALIDADVAGTPGAPAFDAGGLPVHAVWAELGAPDTGRTPPAVPEIDVDLPAVCLLTSGSTGVPQPHVKRWGPIVANIAAEADRLAEHLGRPSLAGVTLVATVPAQHSYGFESSVLLALLGGAAFDAGRPFYPADIGATLAALPRPRALVTTPFHLKALLQSGVALPPVDLLLSATAPLSPQLAAQAEAAGGGVLVEIYGCTEAGQVASRRTTAGETWTTLGALRITRETDAAADAAAIAAERFVVQGGHVVEPTPLADLLELDDARCFRLLGRANDLIHVAGKRSSLGHLNFQLNRIAGVEDGAFWLPEAAPGEVARPVAFVVAPRLGTVEIVGALRRVLDAAFVPRRVVHVDALPREATGKLTAGALDAFARARLGSTVTGAPGSSTVPAASSAASPLASPGAADARAPAVAGATATLTVPHRHPAFDGHFPGQPVLPGAALLAMVMDALAPRAAAAATPPPGLGTFEQAKFLAPVRPGAVLELISTPQQGGGVAFEVHEGARPVARGLWRPAG